MRPTIKLSCVSFGTEGEPRAALLRQPEPGPADVAVATEVLAALSSRSRDALIRFYLDRQSPETITQECGLTESEWKAIKTQARELFFCTRAVRRSAASEVAPGPQRIRA